MLESESERFACESEEGEEEGDGGESEARHALLLL